jgi:hypothetical protein
MNASAVGLAVALVLGTRLALAAGAVAQPPSAEDVASRPQRLEVGGSVGAIWMFPTVGVLASMPATDWLAVEGTVNRSYGAMLTQGQVRIPLVQDRPTKRSLVVGLGHVSGRGRQFTEGLLGHAGISFQQAMARRLDLRLDLQMLMPFDDGPDADPRAVVAVVWRPLDRSRRAAIPSSAIVHGDISMRRTSGEAPK